MSENQGYCFPINITDPSEKGIFAFDHYANCKTKMLTWKDGKLRLVHLSCLKIKVMDAIDTPPK